MSLHEQIKSEIKDAMRAKAEIRLSVVRALVAAFTNEAVAKKRKPDEILTDEEALVVIKREANKRKDSIEQFEKGGRTDLASREKAELEILQKYLPAQMGQNEIRKVVEVNMKELGITDKSRAGQLTGAVMKELKGRADGGDVKAVVDSLLA